MEQKRLVDMIAIGQFEIPHYQRAYSWEEKQQEQLIDDLREAKGKYYMGHFLFESSDNNVSYVIDGQQRLTTVVIFFSSLAAELEKRGDDYKNDVGRIRNNYLKADYGGPRRLKTVDYDDTFFMDEIIDRRNLKPETELPFASQRNIRHCREYFDRVFAKESTETLLQWGRTLSNSKVTYLNVTEKVDAVQIFAFSNDRGKPLSQLEVLKSFFMMQIYMQSQSPEDNIQRLYDHFAAIYRKVVKITTHEDDILRYFWMAYGDKGYNSEDTLTEIKKHCQKGHDLEEVIRFTEMLARAFDYVERIEKEKSFYMENLRRLDRMAQAWPLLLKAYVLTDAEEANKNRLVRLLENITFRSVIRGGRADIRTRLNRLLQGFTDNNSLCIAIDSFKEGMKSEYWNDEELRDALDSGFIYGRQKACVYFLWRYEQSLCPKDYLQPKVAWEDMIRQGSLDHIAPQHPGDEPLAKGYGNYVDTEHPEEGIESGNWLHSIGNMLLMSQSQNSKMGNKDFESVKLSSFKNDNLMWQQKEITEFLDDKNHPVWNKNAIERRGKHLIEAALKIWSLDLI